MIPRTLIAALAMVVAYADARADQHGLSPANRRLNELVKLDNAELTKARRVEIIREVADILTDKSSGSNDKEYAANVFRRFAVPPSLVGEEQVEQLTTALSSPERRLKCEVAETLKALGPVAKSAIPALEKVAAEKGDDLDEYHVVHALAALAEIDPEKFGECGREALIAKFEHKRNWVRRTAAYELNTKALDSPEVRQTLRHALEDESVSVRVAAAWSLCKLGEPADDKLIGVLASAISGKAESTWTEPPYLSEDGVPSNAVAIWTTWLVYKEVGHVPEELQTALRKSLASSDDWLRLYAMRVVVKTGLKDAATRDAVEELVAKESMVDVHAMATQWLKESSGK